jgi:hypothetical protein
LQAATTWIVSRRETELPAAIRFWAWNSGYARSFIDLDLVSDCRMLVEEVSMSLVSFRAPASVNHRRSRGVIFCVLLCCAAIALTLTLAGFAQMPSQGPSGQPRTVLLPETNRLPDANDQMLMRERNTQMRNFDAANAQRLKQLMQASEALETMAMALKAEVDKSEDLSQNTIHKAETIEKLARIVKDRMKLSIAPQ